MSYPGPQFPWNLLQLILQIVFWIQHTLLKKILLLTVHPLLNSSSMFNPETCVYHCYLEDSVNLDAGSNITILLPIIKEAMLKST